MSTNEFLLSALIMLCTMLVIAQNTRQHEAEMHLLNSNFHMLQLDIEHEIKLREANKHNKQLMICEDKDTYYDKDIGICISEPVY